jgi:polyisoprenyl-phosphate glycosyltransferase
MKIIFVTPVYNDWESVKILSNELKKACEDNSWDSQLIIVNDCSTETINYEKESLSIKSEILNLYSNQGNQKCITIGLSYVYDCIDEYDYVIVLDADGEDKPSDIIKLVESCKNNNNDKIIFSKREKRNENKTYIFFYTIYKFLFYLLTGKTINIGHFSCVPKKLVSKILSVEGISTHYCAALIKSKLSYNTVPLDKGPRYKGKTNQSKRMLVFHGLASMIVFQDIITLKAFVISLIGIFFTSLLFIVIFVAKIFSTEMILGLNFNTNTMITLTIVFLIFIQIFILSLYHLINKESKMALLDKKIYKKFIIS